MLTLIGATLASDDNSKLRDQNAQMRVLMGPTKRPPRYPIATPIETPRELTATELMSQPTATLSRILQTLDVFVAELSKRAVEGSITLRDVKAFSDLVKAHSTLRQTQLAEDQFARQSQTLATDTDVAALLVEAVAAGGPEARLVLRQALAELDAHTDTDTDTDAGGKP